MSNSPPSPFRWFHYIFITAIITGLGSLVVMLASKPLETKVDDLLEGPQLTVRVIGPDQYVPQANPITSALVPDTVAKFDDMPRLGAEPAHWYQDSYTLSDIGAEQLMFRLEFRTPSTGQVIIERIDVDVVERSAPKVGWYIGTGGCGMAMMNSAVLDLDATPVALSNWTRTIQREDGTVVSQDAPDNAYFFVTNTDVELLSLDVYTREAYVAFRLNVHYSGPDGTGHVVVDNSGLPFQVSAVSNARAYQPDWPNDTLVRNPRWDGGINMC